jgi:hypothetical protein
MLALPKLIELALENINLVNIVIDCIACTCDNYNCDEFFPFIIQVLTREEPFQNTNRSIDEAKLYRVIDRQFRRYNKPNDFVEQVIAWHINLLDSGSGTLDLLEIVNEHPHLIATSVDTLHEKLCGLLVSSEQCTNVCKIISLMSHLTRLRRRSLGFKVMPFAISVYRDQPVKVHSVLSLLNDTLLEDCLQPEDVTEFVPTIVGKAHEYIKSEIGVAYLLARIATSITKYNYLIREYKVLSHVLKSIQRTNAETFTALDVIIILLKSNMRAVITPVINKIVHKWITTYEILYYGDSLGRLPCVFYYLMRYHGNLVKRYTRQIMNERILHREPCTVILATLVVYNYNMMAEEYPYVVATVWRGVIQTRVSVHTRVVLVTLLCKLIDMGVPVPSVKYMIRKTLKYFKKNLYTTDDPEVLQIAGETLLRLEVGQDCETPSIKLAISTAKNCKIYPIKFADVVIGL